jgi:hypothetical protein
MRVIPSFVLAWLVGGCTPAVSTLMVPIPGVLNEPLPGSATILFVSDVPPDIWTVYDAEGTFHGELVGRSAFETRITPGKHVFAASILRGRFNYCVTFTGEYEAGKYYIAWFVMRDHRREGYIAEMPWTWLFPRPDSRTIDTADVAAAARALLFEPNVAEGQKFLSSFSQVTSECITSDRTQPNPVSFGFDSVP